MNKRHKRRRHRRISIILIVAAILLLAGCGIFYFINKGQSYNENAESAKDKIIENDMTVDNNNNLSTEKSSFDDSIITFADLAKYSFSFSSGAGGWSDDFNIEKDGYFHGNYHDSDMGDVGDDYPDGTFYYCEYEGHFENIQKVDEFTYKMQMKDIKVINNEGEYINDGTRYVPLAPYALHNAGEVDIYMPGKSVSELDEELQMWLSISFQNQQDRLDNLALVNVNENQGITSYERMPAKEEAESIYNNTKESYDYYGDIISAAATTADMVVATSNQIGVSDTSLNTIWRLVKYNTDEETFKKALEEQRQWLKDRDAEAQKAADEYNGGSFATVAYNDTYATMTLERCKELLKYLD